MKTTSPRMAALLVTVFPVIPLAHADEWTSLSGSGDSIELASGQAAFIVSASEPIVVRYEKPGQHRKYFTVGQVQSQRTYWEPDRAFAPREEVDFNVSLQRPFTLAGPATVTVATGGVLTMRVTDDDSTGTTRTATRRFGASPGLTPLRR